MPSALPISALVSVKTRSSRSWVREERVLAELLVCGSRELNWVFEVTWSDDGRATFSYGAECQVDPMSSGDRSKLRKAVPIASWQLTDYAGLPQPISSKSTSSARYVSAALRSRVARVIPCSAAAAATSAL
jgi:hypothetical protein